MKGTFSLFLCLQFLFPWALLIRISPRSTRDCAPLVSTSLTCLPLEGLAGARHAEGAASSPVAGSGAPLAPALALGCPGISWVLVCPVSPSTVCIWLRFSFGFVQSSVQGQNASLGAQLHMFSSDSLLFAQLQLTGDWRSGSWFLLPLISLLDVFFSRMSTLTHKLEFQTAEYSPWTPRVN